MKQILNSMLRKVELHRYKMLAKDGLSAKVYRLLIMSAYPIINTQVFLSSKIVNRRNREKLPLYKQINEAATDDVALRKDLILSYLFYHIVPWEYSLYNFKKQSHKERLEWLSDADRYMCCDLIMGTDPYLTLKDKYQFYQLAKGFYKRQIFVFTPDTTKQQLLSYISDQSKLFVKPVDGSLGRDTFIVSSELDRDLLYDKLLELKGNWLIESAITQSKDIADWNESSVNTVRIPSLRNNGEWHILQPFFRTGRKGQIVDNAGAGGILCVVDENTGVVITDGYDENHNVYVKHPDSELIYKGWKIPRWQELISLTNEIHTTLPESFKYVGFDFALTDKGWDLIEGNWGQFVGQIAAQKGIKHLFDSYLGIQYE